MCVEGKADQITKLGILVDITGDGWAVIQRDLNRMEKWPKRNLMKSSKGKCQDLLNLGRNNPTHQGWELSMKQFCKDNPGDF